MVAASYPTLIKHLKDTTPELYFFIDKAHFPYQYQPLFNSGDITGIDVLGSADSWMVWTFRTYLELKNHYKCLLVDEMPDSGIIFFFRGSVSLQTKPTKKQYWVCMVADAVWHPYSHINIFQNLSIINKYPQSCFIRLWDQPNIIKSTSTNIIPKNLAFFGDTANLAHELMSSDWHSFIQQQGFTFEIPHFSKWNDYTDIDIVIGIRSFSDSNLHHNKPASKLINSWLGNVVFIGGADIALELERQNSYDYIKITNYTELKKILIDLKNDKELFKLYRLQSVKCAEKFPPGFFVNEWMQLINSTIIPSYKKYQQQSAVARMVFLIKRFIIYRSEAFSLRVKRMIGIIK